MAQDVIIVGGGPAGMMAGLLFARAGVRTLVLEKHGDFLRDFRGDTVHPSTMEILGQLEMLERFLSRPHDRIDQAEMRYGGRLLKLGDLRFLNSPTPFIAMMPQWDFLDFLKGEAAAYPCFSLEMNADVIALCEAHGRISGVRLTDGRVIEAGKLVIMADGRNSLVRRDVLLPLTELGAPMDIFWFALPTRGDRAVGLRASVEVGHMLVQIGRGDYWQCAFLIPKGSADTVRREGISAMRARIESVAPELAPLDDVLTDMTQMHLLSVTLDRLDRWQRPGLLAIGDAAHAMSPIGGIGINLAIQDAVAAANLLAAPMRLARHVDGLLARVEARRRWPTRVIQAGQRTAQDRLISALFRPGMTLGKPPLPFALLNRYAWLRRIPGRIIGHGVRRERIISPAVRG